MKSFRYLLFALLLGALSIPIGALARTGNSSYCAVVESTSGRTVATGFIYTSENGREYCREIPDVDNYVCLDTDGQLPTRTETVTETNFRRTTVTYTLRHIVWREVPSYGSFNHDDHASAEEQAEWDAQYTPELSKIFYPGDAVTDLPPDNAQRHLRDTQVTASGPYEEVDVERELRYTNLVHNSDGDCPPDPNARRTYDALPSHATRDTRSDSQKCRHEALNSTPQMFDYVCDGADPIQRKTPLPASDEGKVRHTTRTEEKGEIKETVCTQVETRTTENGNIVTGWFCE